MSVCDICGAEVYKAQLHRAWHKAHEAHEENYSERVDDLIFKVTALERWAEQ